LTATITDLSGDTLTHRGKAIVDTWRLANASECRRSFYANGKPHDITTGFILASQLELNQNVQVVSNVKDFRCTTEPVVLCAVLLGHRIQDVTLADPRVDSALALSRDGGYIVRSRNQILPLVAFGAQSDDGDTIQAVRKHVSGWLTALADAGPPPTGPEESTICTATQGCRNGHVELWDVMCDRIDNRAANHFGNRRFAILVAMHMSKHPNLNKNNDNIREKVARSIVRAIRGAKSSGRFLVKVATTTSSSLSSSHNNTWEDIGEESAVRWVVSFLYPQQYDQNPASMAK